MISHAPLWPILAKSQDFMLSTTSFLKVRKLAVSKLVISIEEEKAIIEGLDEKDWIKLLNRRVQHYGYEFVYGANNVDKTKHLGDYPDFIAFLIPSKHCIIK